MGSRSGRGPLAEHPPPAGPKALSQAVRDVPDAARVALTGVTASPSSIDAGQWVNFSSAPSGGYPPYNLTWYGLPAPCNSSWTPVVDCLPPFAATFSIYANVSDSFGFNATSGTLTFTVLSDPAVAVSANRTTLPVGASVQFSAVASGGTGTYLAYAWSTSTPQLGCGSSTGPTLDCTPMSLGSGWTVSVSVTDSNGGVSAAGTSPPVSTQPSLSVPAPVANLSSVDVGQWVTFNVTPSGGAPPYAYSWTGLPSGCLSSNAATISCQVQSAGPSLVQVAVVDSSSATATSPGLAFMTYADPVVVGPSATPVVLDAGLSANLSVSATAGAGGFVYSWQGLPAGCPTSGAQVRCTFPVVGTYPLRVHAVDANRYGVLSPLLNVSVVTGPTVTVTGTKSTLDLGQSVTLLALVRGGVGNSTFNWSSVPCALGPPSPSGFPAAVTCIPVVTGEFNATASATDRVGATAVSAPFRLYVWPRPWISNFSASTLDVPVGGSTTLFVVAFGGGGALHYNYSGLPKGCASVDSALLSCTVARPGTFSVRVVVSDPTGANATATLMLRAYGAPPPASAASPPPPLTFTVTVLGAGVALVVVLLFAVYVLFRRSRGTSRLPQTGFAGLPSRAIIERQAPGSGAPDVLPGPPPFDASSGGPPRPRQRT